MQRVRPRDKKEDRVFDYQEWREQQQRYDASGLSDPDILGNRDDEPLNVIEEEEICQEVANKANKVKVIAKKILTDKEYQVFLHLVVGGRSLNSTAKLLTKIYGTLVSKSLVQDTWERAREKLSKVVV